MLDYLGLFVAAFLAATLLPFASEVPLAILVRASGDVAWPVAVATLGNYLGACTTYALARAAVRTFVPKPGPAHSRAVNWIRRYGAPALVLSWVPVLGDALVAVAGVARLPFAAFSVWTLAGKALRYAFVAWAARP